MSKLYPYVFPSSGKIPMIRGVIAKNTGEKRFPKKGELFLSGNPVEAHLAVHDMTMEYYIAIPVIAERIVTVTHKIKKEFKSVTEARAFVRQN